MRKVLLIILMGLVAWDVATTYYGTLSIFTPNRYGGYSVFEKIGQADFFVQLVSLIFAIALIVFILSYKIIFNAKNGVTIKIMYVAFIYDLATSFYGTAQAVGMDANNIPQWFVIGLLAIMTTSAPLLISHIMEDENEGGLLVRFKRED